MEQPGGPLTDAELSRARSTPSYGEVVAVIDGDQARQYVGTAALQVSTGSVSGTLLVLTLTATGPLQGLTGHFLVPDRFAQTLAASGWDFVLTPADLGVEDNVVGDALNGTIESVRVRADPNGLFVMTVLLDEGGRERSVDLAGRLTGGCAMIDAEGGVTLVPDLSSVPVCESVLGAF